MSDLPIATLADLAASIGDQPELFSAPDTKAVVTAREFAHTGRWTMQDSKKVQQIIAAWLNTGSMRKTADLCSVSRNTVSAVIQLLEKAGKLEPLKTRFERARLETGMEQLTWVREVIEERDLEAAAIVLKPGWVGIGIVSDKEAAQPPMQVNVTVHSSPVDGPADPVAEYERRLRQARTRVVVDVESAVCQPKSLATIPPSDPATALDTAKLLPPPPSSPPPTPSTDLGTPGGGSDSEEGPVDSVG